MMGKLAKETYMLTRKSMNLQEPEKVDVIQLLVDMKRKLDAEVGFLCKKQAF